MTDISTIAEYIEHRNKVCGQPDDFATFIHDAFVFSNTEARLLVSYLETADNYNGAAVDYHKIALVCAKAVSLLNDKLKETYGERAEEWKREQISKLRDAISRDISRNEAPT